MSIFHIFKFNEGREFNKLLYDCAIVWAWLRDRGRMADGRDALCATNESESEEDREARLYQ